jgi:hypothetical protein
MNVIRKHIVFAAFILFACFETLYAQAPFSGGESEGHASVKLENSACEATDANPFAGGNGNGFAHGIFGDSTCVPEVFSIYLGGVGYGFSLDSIRVADCAWEVYNIYEGGIANGFSNDTMIVSECYSIRINIFEGGIANGFSQTLLKEPECESVRINIFEGGIGNGFANIMEKDPPECFSIRINIFEGGEGNGFDQAEIINEHCVPEVFSIFLGGEGNGFAQLEEIVSECFEEVLNIYAGGASDGHDFFTVTGSIQFYPFETTGVCENADAVITLDSPGNNLLFQWELSTDGGNTFSPLADNATYSGVETEELEITNVTTSFDGYVYRVIVTNPGCITIESPTTTIEIGSQPIGGTVTKDPNVEHVCEGDLLSASFTSGSGGAGNAWDVTEFTVNHGQDWEPYVENDDINTTGVQGINVVKVRTFRTSDGQGCIDSAEDLVEWTVAGEGFWIGVSSADWNTQSNWGCGVIPDITTDVTIPQVQIGNNQPNIFNTPNAYARDLTIEPNASVTTFFGNTLEIHGDFVNDGIASLGIGNVLFKGSTKQSIGGLSNSNFSYLLVDNDATGFALELNQNITVTDELEIVEGMVDLNGFDINLSSTGTLIGETETSRITGASGEIRSQHTLAANTTYNNISGLGVDITTSAIAPGLANVNRGHHTYSIDFNNYGIQRYFRIEPNTNSGLDATLRIHYFDGELAPGTHDELNLITWRSTDDGITWEGQFFPTNLSNDPAQNWVQQTGIDAFSFWTLSDWLNEPLPVQLLHFTAVPNGSVVDLEWVTASEINNNYFTVERSLDVSNFSDLLTQPGAGNSNMVLVYNDVDPNPFKGISYYRLRQTDFDGTTSHSQIVPVFFDGNITSINAYVDGNRNFQLNYEGTDRENVMLTVFDVMGRMVIKEQHAAGKGENTIKLTNPGLASGVYILQLESLNKKWSKKLFVR